MKPLIIFQSSQAVTARIFRLLVVSLLLTEGVGRMAGADGANSQSKNLIRGFLELSYKAHPPMSEVVTEIFDFEHDDYDPGVLEELRLIISNLAQQKYSSLDGYNRALKPIVYDLARSSNFSYRKLLRVHRHKEQFRFDQRVVDPSLPPLKLKPEFHDRGSYTGTIINNAHTSEGDIVDVDLIVKEGIASVLRKDSAFSDIEDTYETIARMPELSQAVTAMLTMDGARLPGAKPEGLSGEDFHIDEGKLKRILEQKHASIRYTVTRALPGFWTVRLHNPGDTSTFLTAVMSPGEKPRILAVAHGDLRKGTFNAGGIWLYQEGESTPDWMLNVVQEGALFKKKRLELYNVLYLDAHQEVDEEVFAFDADNFYQVQDYRTGELYRNGEFVKELGAAQQPPRRSLIHKVWVIPLLLIPMVFIYWIYRRIRPIDPETMERIGGRQ